MFELSDSADDTSPEAKIKMIELLAQMPPEKKLSSICDLRAFARSLIITEMKQQYTFRSENHFKQELAVRIYGQNVGSQIAKFNE